MLKSVTSYTAASASPVSRTPAAQRSTTSKLTASTRTGLDVALNATTPLSTEDQRILKDTFLKALNIGEFGPHYMKEHFRRNGVDLKKLYAVLEADPSEILLEILIPIVEKRGLSYIDRIFPLTTKEVQALLDDSKAEQKLNSAAWYYYHAGSECCLDSLAGILEKMKTAESKPTNASISASALAARGFPIESPSVITVAPLTPSTREKTA